MAVNIVNLLTLKCVETIIKMRPKNGKCTQNSFQTLKKWRKNWKSSNFENAPNIFEKFEQKL